MPTSQPDLVEIIEFVVQRMMAQFFAPLPARVVSYDQETQRIDVQPRYRLPRYNDVSGTLDYVDAPLLRDVPVLVPGSPSSAACVKLDEGDPVLLIILMYSLDELLDSDNQGVCDPADPRQQAMQDCFAIPMVLQTGNVFTGAPLLDRYFNGDVTIGDFNTAEALALKRDVDELRGKLDALVTAHNNHLHSGVTSGGGSSGGPTVTGTAPGAMTGTTNLKAS